ncbi:PTS sucrose transporter subunit IIBC [Thermogemmatispora tikiterensis]|uniref:Uncharacterized protein n=1 Tax=Thermogemmatispora tikiterensis TaxID=1825093 RepID=A0A328VLD2_9CHLR|nr:PTS sucrose transporter subunit IIBC [Thermogemmatispora tikiterensis]RAQ96610.1 hypothetical protein A4R35_13770 [Thermogemmatispora tikiterensis]
MGGPALIINPSDGLFLASLFGFLLSLPLSLFVIFWVSVVLVRRRWIVLLGAFIGAFIGLLAILGWVDTLIFDTPLPNAQVGATFFGALFLCSILGLVGGMLADWLAARSESRRSRRQTTLLPE